MLTWWSILLLIITSVTVQAAKLLESQTDIFPCNTFLEYSKEPSHWDGSFDVWELRKMVRDYLILAWGIHMGESFQDYSWIQGFEADFPQKVSLKMLN